MGKRKAQIVEPEAFDPDERSPVVAPLPGMPQAAPSYPGDADDSDDEREDENEAVPDGAAPRSITVDAEVENRDTARGRLREEIDAADYIDNDDTDNDDDE